MPMAKGGKAHSSNITAQRHRGSGALRGSGPCILSAVVESTGRARQTGSGPAPKRPQEAVGSRRAPLLAKRARTELPGASRGKQGERARIRKDGGHKTKEVPPMVHVSARRLRRRGWRSPRSAPPRGGLRAARAASGGRRGHTFGVPITTPPARKTLLVARLLWRSVPCPGDPLWRPPGALNGPWPRLSLAAAGLPVAVVNPRQARDFARATVRAALYMGALWSPRATTRRSQAVLREAPTAAGKPRKVALVACMRKLVIILNAAMLKNRTPWRSPQILAS
jgi:hypothetical protein